MIPYLLPFIYVIVCLLTAYFGRNTRIGYWGTFFLSVIVTPLVVVIGLILLGEARATRGRAEQKKT
jgi:hypothetical protein